jgi:hypothetical protein
MKLLMRHLFLHVEPSSRMSPQDIPISDGPLGFVFRHFWIAFIVATSSNAWVAWQRSVQPRIDADPRLEGGYRALFRSSLVLMNVPWFLMGLGILSGRVSSVHEYLVPSSGNTAVVIWWGAMAAFAAAGTVWMLSGAARRASRSSVHSGIGNARANQIVLDNWVRLERSLRPAPISRVPLQPKDAAGDEYLGRCAVPFPFRWNVALGLHSSGAPQRLGRTRKTLSRGGVLSGSSRHDGGTNGNDQLQRDHSTRC